MSSRLGERFIEARGSPIEVDGKLVRMSFELPPIRSRTELRIQIETDSVRPQGVRLKARGGKLEMNGRLEDNVVLCSDTAPRTVTADMRPTSSRKPMVLRVWNAWRDPAGTMHAWIGDAGIVVDEQAPGTVVLHCSDGFDAPTFDDLVVTLAFDAAELP
jgi:hypothetical protein